MLYTDGSKFKSHVGCAVTTDLEVIYSYPLPSDYSILSAELMAIWLAILYLNESTISQGLICTDSLSAIRSILGQHNTHQHPIAKNILRVVTTNCLTIQLVWIPSHKNVPGNELADQTAKIAALITPINDDPVPASDITSSIHSTIFDSWTTQWRDLPTTNKLREIKSTLSKWIPIPPISRKQETTVRRLRLGHTSPTHLYLLTRATRPTCDHCNTALTV